MAYKEYDYNIMEHIPEESKCFMVDAHSSTKESSSLYLGNKSIPALTIVDMEILTETSDAASEFYEWFVSVIYGGNTPFTALHNLWGETEYYIFKIDSNGISEKILGEENRLISFKAEVIGVSFPSYIIGDNKEVLPGGIIYAKIEPSAPDRLLDPNNFTIELSGVEYEAEYAEIEDNYLKVSTSYPITNYPVVNLTHSALEHGLGIFDTSILNSSEITRAVPSGVSSISDDGIEITIMLDKLTALFVWDNTLIPFTVLADGENVPLSTTVDSASVNHASGELNIYMNISRPIYEHEVITVQFNIEDNSYISPFTPIPIANNSTVVSTEDNTIIGSEVSTLGDTIVCSMEILKDVTYDPSNFTINIDSVPYNIVSAVQEFGTLVLTLGFTITSYPTEVSIHHASKEYGFIAGDFVSVNNSQISRATLESASVSQDGRTLIVSLSRTVGNFYSWLSDFSITSNGVSVDIGYPIIIGDGSSIINIYILYVPIYSDDTVIVSYTETTNMEIENFTDEPVTNNSVVSAPNHIVSGEVSIDGLSIVSTMSTSIDYTYDPAIFNVNNGYLSIEPTHAAQVGTVLTITLPTAIKDGAVITLDISEGSSEIGEASGVSMINNSSIIGANLSSSSVVYTGAYLVLIMDEALKAHSWVVEEFTIKVNGEEKGIASPPYSVDGSYNIWIYTQDIIISSDSVTVSFTTTTDPQIDSFTDVIATNNSISVAAAPIYLMTEPLVISGD